MIVEKVDFRRFKIIQTKEEVLEYDVKQIKTLRGTLQAELNRLDALLLEGEKVGVKPENEEPIPEPVVLETPIA